MTQYVDVTRLLTWENNYTGMERVAYEITKALLERQDADIKLCCYVPGRGFIDIGQAFEIKGGRLTSPLLSAGPGLRRLAKDNKLAFVRHSAKRLGQRRLHKQYGKLSPKPGDSLLVYDGLWDQPGYIAAVKRLSGQGIKLAHVVHDAIPAVMPQVCFDYVTTAFDSYFKQVAPQVDVLYANSLNTMKDFERVYGGLLKPSVSKAVVRWADDFDKHVAAAKPPGLEIKPGQYILSVGTVEVRKNHQLLYQAYRLAAEKRIELPSLVIAGREGWLAEAVVHGLRNDPLVKDKIIFSGPVNDANLRWLYENCLFTVFPSVYEGWGLPVAESLHYGKVCAASGSSSIPEVGGDLNVYYSPYDPAQCLKVIEGLLDTGERQKLEARIKKSYKPTAWQDTAGQIAKQL